MLYNHNKLFTRLSYSISQDDDFLEAGRKPAAGGSNSRKGSAASTAAAAASKRGRRQRKTVSYACSDDSEDEFRSRKKSKVGLEKDMAWECTQRCCFIVGHAASRQRKLKSKRHTGMLRATIFRMVSALSA